MPAKVGIFTTNSVDKLHPRIEMQLGFLEEAGYDVQVVRTSARRDSSFYEFLNLFSFKYFKKGAIASFKNRLDDFDIIHVYDLQLLPLVKIAKRKGKSVIFETLDDNVYLTFSAVKRKLPIIGLFKKLIISYYSHYERKIARNYCDTVIVNSPNLQANFDRSEIIYYASHLERTRVHQFDPEKETVLLYLGKLTESKGANIYGSLLDQTGMRLLFLGKPFDCAAKDLIDNDRVEHLGNFNAEGLVIALEKLIGNYNLIGLSIILPENKSYALQEANKDFDYMAMGIPFIGNDRKPTFEKIELGAGVLFTDVEGIRSLSTNDSDFYNQTSVRAREIYKQHDQSVFKEKLLKIYSDLKENLN